MEQPEAAAGKSLQINDLSVERGGSAPRKTVSEHQCFVSEHQCFVSEHQCFVSEHQCFVSEHQCFAAEHQCFAAEHQCFAAELHSDYPANNTVLPTPTPQKPRQPPAVS
jgi:hypothetical protein